MSAPRPFGRTGQLAPTIWQEHAGGIITADNWLAVTVDRDDLDRKGYDRLHQRLAKLGRRPDLIIIQNVLANDIKAGWPMHRLLQFRDRGACKYFGVEVDSALEAEWIAANAPVHAVILPYHADDMAAKYRVFDAAANAGVALVGRAHNSTDAALQLATPELHGTIVGNDVYAIVPLTEKQACYKWTTYSAVNAEPAKLRSGHPPDDGV